MNPSSVVRCRLTTIVLLAFAAKASAQAPRQAATVIKELVPAGVLEIDDVRGAVAMKNGDLVLTQHLDGHLLVIAANGSIDTIGRRGEGPGEFGTPGSIGLMGDTLWVGDVGLRRTTFFGPGYRVVRTLPYPTSAAASSAGWPTWYALLPMAYHPGGFVLAAGLYDEKAPRTARIAPADWGGTPLLRLTPEGAIQKVVTWLPGATCTAEVPVERGTTLVRIPFCRGAISHITSDGSRIAAANCVEADRRTATCRIRIVSAMGDALVTREVSIPLVAIPGPVRDSAGAAAGSGKTIDAVMRRIPRNYPPIYRILNGSDGSTWIEVHGPSGSGEWWMMDSRGDLRLRVKVPRSVDVLAADRQGLTGLEIRDDGESRLLRFAVIGGN